MKRLIGVELLRKLPAAPAEIRDSKMVGFILRVRPSGRHSYYAVYGRNRWHLLGTSDVLSAPEARDECRKVLADVAKGGDPVATRREAKKDITFEAFVTGHYEPWATAQRKTGAEQTQRLRQVFGSALNALRISEINPFVVERWRSGRLKDGIATTTVNRDLSTLRGALSRGVEWGLLSAHPLTKVKASKTDKRGGIVRYLSADEEERLHKALAARDDRRRADRDSANRWREQRGYKLWPAFGIYSDHLTPLVILALNTGLRRGELFGLRWADIDLVGARLTVRGEQAKSAQTRHVPLNQTALEALKTWHADSEQPETRAFVFPGDDGEPLVDIKGAWAKVLTAALVHDFRFHDCRHSFASRLVMAGVDLNTLRELLGHADIKQVLRYAHLAPEHMAAAVAKLVAV